MLRRRTLPTLAVIACLAACGGGSGSLSSSSPPTTGSVEVAPSLAATVESPTTAASPPPSTTTTAAPQPEIIERHWPTATLRVTLPPNLTPEDRPIYDKYVEFKSGRIELWMHPDPESPILQATLAENLLEKGRQVFAAAQRSGQRVEGGDLDSHPIITIRAGSDIQIEDCSLDEGVLHDYKGVVISPADTSYEKYMTVFRLTDSGWRAISSWEPGEPCVNS